MKNMIILSKARTIKDYVEMIEHVMVLKGKNDDEVMVNEEKRSTIELY